MKDHIILGLENLRNIWLTDESRSRVSSSPLTLTVLLDVPGASESSPVSGYNEDLRSVWWAGHNGHEYGTATVV